MRLSVDRAAYHYETAAASGFRNISFNVEDGEVLSILGPNGCGKTTLLKCLNCLIRLGRGASRSERPGHGRLPAPRSPGPSDTCRSSNRQPSLYVLDTVLVGGPPHLNLLASPKPRE
jgi:iron complex transport system ATP-binding protein